MYLAETTRGEPEADPAWDWVWRCWWRLTDQRVHVTTGMGVPMGGILIRPMPTRIPWSAVVHWAEKHQFSWHMTELLDSMILQMEDEYLKWWAEQNKSE